MAIAHRKIKIRAAIPDRKRNRLWDMRMLMVGVAIIRLLSMNLA